MELRVKRLRRFDLPSADLDHAMIRVGDSAQVVVVAEWSDHRWVAAGSPGLCSWKGLSAWCGWPPSLCVSSSPALCLGLSNYPWRHCDRWHYSSLLPQSVYQAYNVPWTSTERWGVSSSPQCRCGGCRRHTWCGRWCRTRFRESCSFDCPYYIAPEFSCFGVWQVFSHGLSAGDYVSDGQFGGGDSVVQPLPEHWAFVVVDGSVTWSSTCRYRCCFLSFRLCWLCCIYRSVPKWVKLKNTFYMNLGTMNNIFSTSCFLVIWADTVCLVTLW